MKQKFFAIKHHFEKILDVFASRCRLSAGYLFSGVSYSFKRGLMYLPILLYGPYSILSLVYTEMFPCSASGVLYFYIYSINVVAVQSITVT